MFGVQGDDGFFPGVGVSLAEPAAAWLAAAILDVPVPTIGGVRMAQANFLIDVSGLLSGQTYAAQISTNLMTGTWTNETTFAASRNSDDARSGRKTGPGKNGHRG